MTRVKGQEVYFRPYDASVETAVNKLLQIIWAEDTGAISYYAPALEANSKEHFHRTLVAETVHEAEIILVGIGNISHYATHPTHAFLNVNVHPDYRNRGIGKTLYHRLLALLPEHQADAFLTAAYENQLPAMAWVEKLGFQEQMRTYLPRLDVAAVDLDSLQERTRQIADQGYKLRSMAELAAEPKRDEKLADLLFEIYAAMHKQNPPGPALYEKRQEIFLSNLLPEATFIAVHKSMFAAVGSLHKSLRPNALDIGMFGVTAVHQEYALDLALAMKGHEITYALHHQVGWLVAEIDSTDALGMQVMSHLPFHYGPTWITFEKPL